MVTFLSIVFSLIFFLLLIKAIWITYKSLYICHQQPNWLSARLLLQIIRQSDLYVIFSEPSNSKQNKSSFGFSALKFDKTFSEISVVCKIKTWSQVECIKSQLNIATFLKLYFKYVLSQLLLIKSHLNYSWSPLCNQKHQLTFG